MICEPLYFSRVDDKVGMAANQVRRFPKRKQFPGRINRTVHILGRKDPGSAEKRNDEKNIIWIKFRQIPRSEDSFLLLFHKRWLFGVSND
jgi:hypothetical protein